MTTTMLKLRNPYTMIVSGQTGSGKTQFVSKLIKQHAKINEKPFDRFVYLYSVDQPLFRDLFRSEPKLELYNGFPADLDLGSTDGQTLVVLDDLMTELGSDQRLVKLFTKMRHSNVSTIFITQNIYFPSRYGTTITRNAQYMVLFPNMRDASMVATLGRQIYPHMPRFVPSAFDQATNRPFGYLFIDLKTDTDPRLRVRSNIFDGEEVDVYRPSS